MKCKLFMVAMAMMVFASYSSATVVTLGTAGTVSDLFSSTATPDGSILVTDFNTNTFGVDVYSQAYTDGSKYAYLYQLDNMVGSMDPVELFTLSPFAGADENAVVGYLTGTVPTGFLPGVDQSPEPTGNVNASSQIISFYYTSRASFDLNPGQQSAVMYVMSDLAPDLIWGILLTAPRLQRKLSDPFPNRRR